MEGQLFVVHAAADAFKYYDPSLTTGQLEPLAAADKTQSSFSFYTGDYTAATEDATVTCTATITCPDGTVLPPVTVTQALTSFKPTAAVVVNPAGAHFVLTPGVTVDDGVADGDPHAIAFELWWPATITETPPFTGGTGCFAQISTASQVHTRIPQNNASATYTLKIPDGKGGWVALPANSIDDAFPFNHLYDQNGAQVTVNNVPVYTWPAAQAGYSGDAPASADKPVLVQGDTGGTQWIENDVNDSFQTWVMYKPPAPPDGQPVVWVPLGSVPWSWAVSVGNKEAQWGVYTPNPPTFSGGSYSATPTPPQWSSSTLGAAARP